jgi:hypothetical protein
MFASLVHYIPEIDALVEKVRNREKGILAKFHLGNGVYATVSGDYSVVHIRRYFVVDGLELPTKIGIALRLTEWTALTAYIEDIKKLSEVLELAKPCFERDDHMNQIVYLACRECNPFTPDI